MKNLIITLLLSLPVFLSAQVSYTLTTDAGIVAVNADGTMDTLTSAYQVKGEYIAILSHQNTDAPVATVLQNTLGTITWAYSTTGTYTGTVSGGTKFSENKTFCTTTLQERGANPRTYALGRTSDSVVTLSALNSSLSSTDPATTNKIAIHIIVYQ